MHELNRKIHLKHNRIIKTEDFRQKLEICDVPDKSYVWNKIYKTSEIKRHNLHFEEGMIYEDVIFTPQALHKIKNLVTVPDTYYYYWRNSNSIVAQKHTKALADREKAQKWANEFFKTHGIDTKSYSEEVKRYKLFNITIFKIRAKRNKKQYSLFNVIKWTI